jgi:hypothetical protein
MLPAKVISTPIQTLAKEFHADQMNDFINYTDFAFVEVFAPSDIDISGLNVVVPAIFKASRQGIDFIDYPAVSATSFAINKQGLPSGVHFGQVREAFKGGSKRTAMHGQGSWNQKMVHSQWSTHLIQPAALLEWLVALVFSEKD